MFSFQLNHFGMYEASRSMYEACKKEAIANDAGSLSPFDCAPSRPIVPTSVNYWRTLGKLNPKQRKNL